MEKPTPREFYDVDEIDEFITEKHGMARNALFQAVNRVGSNPDSGALVTLDRNAARKQLDKFGDGYLANAALNAMHDEFGELVYVRFWW